MFRGSQQLSIFFDALVSDGAARTGPVVDGLASAFVSTDQIKKVGIFFDTSPKIGPVLRPAKHQPGQATFLNMLHDNPQG